VSLELLLAIIATIATIFQAVIAAIQMRRPSSTRMEGLSRITSYGGVKTVPLDHHEPIVNSPRFGERRSVEDESDPEYDPF
jgi:hypothetical protein